MFSFRQLKETDPLLSPIWLSTEAATFSSSSSIWSPVFAFVPPERKTSPVSCATPCLSAGSKRLPVRISAPPDTKRQFVILQQENLDAVRERELHRFGYLKRRQRRVFQFFVRRQVDRAAMDFSLSQTRAMRRESGGRSADFISPPSPRQAGQSMSPSSYPESDTVSPPAGHRRP